MTAFTLPLHHSTWARLPVPSGLWPPIRARGHKTSYCKPVGQEFVELGNLKVDKDALLFARGMDFELKAELHSPVIIGRGVTSDFLDDPHQFNFASAITKGQPPPSAG